MPTKTNLEYMRKTGVERTIGNVGAKYLHGNNNISIISFSGLWLNEMGFKPKDKVLVKVVDERIVITKQEV